MINKLEVIQERLNNIQFHIDHVNHAMANPDLYNIPDNKTKVNLVQYLEDLASEKRALEVEKESLTNQV